MIAKPKQENPHMSEKNVPQAIYHICAAIMFICLSVFALVGAVQARRAGEAIGTYFGELSAYQKQLQQQATAGSEILSEVLAYGAARGLEQAEMLSPTEANAIATDAIKNITAKSERWGKIARAINDGILKEQRSSR
jgi:hypothetical protein